MTSLREQLTIFLEPIKLRILSMFARAVVRKVDDSAGVQLVQIEALEDEVKDGVERFQDYGFTGVPPTDSEAIVCFVGGNRSHPLMLRVDSRTYRKMGLQPGEVAVYTRFGGYMHLTEDHELHVRANKWKMQGATDELMTVLKDITTEVKDLADKLNQDTTNTMLGPMKLNGFAYYGARRDALTALITKLQGLTAS